MGVLPRQWRVEPLHRLSGVADGWRGPLQLTPCCDKQQMFSNNVYRPGLHLQTHTHLFPVKQAQRGHPSTELWVAAVPPDPHATRNAGRLSRQQCCK